MPTSLPQEKPSHILLIFSLSHIMLDRGRGLLAHQSAGCPFYPFFTFSTLSITAPASVSSSRLHHSHPATSLPDPGNPADTQLLEKRNQQGCKITTTNRQQLLGKQPSTFNLAKQTNHKDIPLSLFSYLTLQLSHAHRQTQAASLLFTPLALNDHRLLFICPQRRCYPKTTRFLLLRW